MIINRYYILGIFGFFILLFTLLFFGDFSSRNDSENEREIVWIEKPSFMLLKDLRSKNPVLRREAIIKLGEKRVKTAAKPLFEILFSNEYPFYEKQMAAKSLALISGEEIIQFCLKMLQFYKEDKSREIVLSMLYILKNIDTSSISLDKYDFSILSKIIEQSKNNDIILNAIETIENLKYMKAFYSLEKIYMTNFLYKVAILKAMTQIALGNEDLSKWLSRFLAKIIWIEKHDDVKKTIRESLFTITLNKKPDSRESLLIGLISQLGSSNLKNVLDAENKLLGMEIEEKDQETIRFFLKDLEPIVANRLIFIIGEKKLPGFYDDLVEIIKNRYTNTKDWKDVYYDSAYKATIALAKTTTRTQDISFLVSLFQEPVIGDAVLEAFYILLKRKTDTSLIENKIQYYVPYSLLNTQKHWLYPYLKIISYLNDLEKAEKLIQGGENYVRYNTLNFLIQTKRVDKISIKNKDKIMEIFLENYIKGNQKKW